MPRLFLRIINKNILGSNYYDLALSLCRIYYRTGDPYWRDKARFVARTWRDASHNRNLAAWLAGDWSLGCCIVNGRGMATLGLAVLALESNDQEAARIVNDHANIPRIVRCQFLVI